MECVQVLSWMGDIEGALLSHGGGRVQNAASSAGFWNPPIILATLVRVSVLYKWSERVMVCLDPPDEQKRTTITLVRIHISYESRYADSGA